jgi:hypothetical protein
MMIEIKKSFRGSHEHFIAMSNKISRVQPGLLGRVRQLGRADQAPQGLRVATLERVASVLEEELL